MTYTKTTWVNGSEPAINAGNLNKIETGIFDNDAAITTLSDAVSALSGGTVSDLSTAVSVLSSSVSILSGSVSILTSNFDAHIAEASHQGGMIYAYRNLGGAL